MTQPAQSQSQPAVVDTDVLSFWQRQDSRGAEYWLALAGRPLILSFQTVAEQLRWANERNWSARRRQDLEQYLARFLVIPYSIDLARTWAEVMTESRRQGRLLSSGDAWIASTALIVGAALATHNRRHFETVAGLSLISFAPESGAA